MSDLLREAPFGQVVRFVTRNKYFQYPEEKPDFVCPHSYKPENAVQPENRATNETKGSEGGNGQMTPANESNLKKLESSNSSASDLERQPTLGLQRTQTLPYTAERLEIEQRLNMERTKSKPILPAKTANGVILADWYTTDDPANPQNWSQKKKFLVALLIE
jgi:MFS transporter, DHA1 family, multidrug resistance protein